MRPFRLNKRIDLKPSNLYRRSIHWEHRMHLRRLQGMLRRKRSLSLEPLVVSTKNPVTQQNVSPLTSSSKKWCSTTTHSFNEARIIHHYGKLVSGYLIKRYKRFLADVELENGEKVTVYCPNTGPMVGLLEKEMAEVRLSESSNPKRKYKYTLEMIRVECKNSTTWVGVHSALANSMVEVALQKNLIQLNSSGVLKSFRKEVKYGSRNSRVDFVVNYWMDDQPSSTVFTEVKSVTLKENDLLNEPNRTIESTLPRAVFPDTVSVRAQKHMEELIDTANSKDPKVTSAVVFLIQRDDCLAFSPSYKHDPVYAKLCHEAFRQGVQLVAYTCQLDPDYNGEGVVFLKESVSVTV